MLGRRRRAVAEQHLTCANPTVLDDSLRKLRELSVVCHNVRGMRQTSDRGPEMIIDCDSCVVRGLACEDCVVSVLLGIPENVEIDALEQRAIDTLSRAGIVPRLRVERANRSA
jgi:hypothetical protein